MVPFPEALNESIERSYFSDKSIVAGALNGVEVHVSFVPSSSLNFGKEGEPNLIVVKINRVGKNTAKFVDSVCMVLSIECIESHN